MEKFYSPICRHCGKPLEKVNLQCFMHDDSDASVPTEVFCIKTDSGSYAVSISTDVNWCGYDLTDEERKEDISCPYCRHFPFGPEEIETHEPVNIVCWTDKAAPVESPEDVLKKTLATIIHRVNETVTTKDDSVALTGALLHIREYAQSVLERIESECASSPK